MRSVASYILVLVTFWSICYAGPPLDSSLRAALEDLARMTGDEAAEHHYRTSDAPLGFDTIHHPVSTHPVHGDERPFYVQQVPGLQYADRTSASQKAPAGPSNSE